MARGSTLLNITQQVAASMGTALFSVILTNELKGHDSVAIAGAVREAGDNQGAVAAVLEKFGLSTSELNNVLAQVPGDMADSFATVFIVATILVACCTDPSRSSRTSRRPGTKFPLPGDFVPGRWHFGATMCPLGVCGVSRLTIEIGPST